MASITRYRTSALLKFNIQAFLEREFVNSGQYFNVASGHIDVNGSRGDILRRADGRTYESFTDRWVYESDASGAASFPTTRASGVTIDGVFHLKGSSPFIPVIDYDNGRILFNGTEVDSSSTVETTFTYKHIRVDFPDSNIINQIFAQIKNNFASATHIYPSGNQRQLPFVVIDLQDRDSRPMELGGGKIREQRIVFHVLTNDENDRDTICDILEEQHRKVFQGVNYNNAPQLLTYQGDLASTYADYTTLQASGNTQWVKIYIDEARIIEKNNFHELKRGRVDWTITTFHRAV
jgi:hypothetical protein